MLFRQTLDGINNQYSWLQRASGAVGSMCDYRSEGSWFPLGSSGCLCICSFYNNAFKNRHFHSSLLVVKASSRFGNDSTSVAPSTPPPHPHPAEDVPCFPPNMTSAIKTNYSSIMSPILLESCSDG